MGRKQRELSEREKLELRIYFVLFTLGGEEIKTETLRTIVDLIENDMENENEQ